MTHSPVVDIVCTVNACYSSNPFACFQSAGLFNVGNKLLVSLDLLFAIRNQIKLGEDPRMSVSVVLKSVQEQTGKVISGSVLSTELNFSDRLQLE